MITVLPAENEAQARALYESAGLSYRNGSDGVCARDTDGTLLGYALFDIDQTVLLLRCLVPADQPALADGVLRSALHVAVCRGVIEARYSAEADEALLESLRFIADKPTRKLDVGKLFRRCGACGEKKT